MNYKILRITIFFFILFGFSNLKAQFNSEFNKKEAKDMIALCNSFTFIKVLNSDKNIIPKGYEKVYQSGAIGLDNQWQMWKYKNYAVINLRGSTSEQISWLGNMYAAMIPANGEIILPGDEHFKYKLSINSNANIHSGWTLSMAFMANDILQHIKMLNYEGIHHFIITGHSQGAAIAQLLRAYLENLPDSKIDKKNKFKTYVFASPMVGNISFVDEYYQRFGETSFIINNPIDPITKMPFTIDKKSMFDLKDISEHLIDTNKNYLETIAYRAIGKVLFGNPDSAYIDKAGENVYQQLRKSIGPFSMPPYQLDMNYKTMPNPIYIGPFREAEIKNKRYISKFNLNPEQSFFQHKPYLYFLYLTKTYFPEDFKKM